jgi:hypothetical protein
MLDHLGFRKSLLFIPKSLYTVLRFLRPSKLVSASLWLIDNNIKKPSKNKYFNHILRGRA